MRNIDISGGNREQPYVFRIIALRCLLFDLPRALFCQKTSDWSSHIRIHQLAERAHCFALGEYWQWEVAQACLGKQVAKELEDGLSV